MPTLAPLLALLQDAWHALGAPSPALWITLHPPGSSLDTGGELTVVRAWRLNQGGDLLDVPQDEAARVIRVHFSGTFPAGSTELLPISWGSIVPHDEGVADVSLLWARRAGWARRYRVVGGNPSLVHELWRA